MKQIVLVGNQDLGELCIKENQVACQQEALKQEVNNTFEKSNAWFFFFFNFMKIVYYSFLLDF